MTFPSEPQPELQPSPGLNSPLALSSRRDPLFDPERPGQPTQQHPGSDSVPPSQSTAQPNTHAPVSPDTTEADPLTSGLPAGLTFRLLHVGVAVPALDPAAESLRTLLGYRVVSGPFDDPIQKVSVSFLTQADDNVAEIELIAPLTPDSPITSTLRKSGGGAYHLCFETNDLERALDHVKSHKCLVISPPNPAVAFEGRRIAWFYTPQRQLIELVEAPSA